MVIDIKNCKKQSRKGEIHADSFEHPVECRICHRHFYNLDIHHIDGNHKNDVIENRIRICAKCHANIHHPSKNRGKK